MNAKKILKKELKAIADQFPELNIRYGYDDIIETHIIEFLPFEEIDANKKLEETWIELYQLFLENFEDEEIAFVSANSTLAIKNIIFEFNRKVFLDKKIIHDVTV